MTITPLRYTDEVIDDPIHFSAANCWNKMDNVATLPSEFQIDTNILPRVAVIPGSYNPFHLGHLNIAMQAERMFDRVIIVQAVNGEKAATTRSIKDLKSLKRYTCVQFDGLLTDYLEELSKYNDVTLVRGLRNSLDLQAEINLTRYYQDLMPGLKIIYLLCDRQFEHISSSAIRVLEKFGKEGEYIVT